LEDSAGASIASDPACARPRLMFLELGKPFDGAPWGLFRLNIVSSTLN